MLQKLQYRHVAWLLTGVVVVFAIFAGASNSLRAVSNKAEALFTADGADTTKGIQYDLQEIIADSNNLLTVAGGYLAADHITMDQLRRSISTLELSGGAAQKYAAAQQLRKAVQDLDQQLAALPLDDTAKGYRSKLVANIESHYKILENSRYNAAAMSFNKELTMFPANLLAPIVGVESLELFA